MAYNKAMEERRWHTWKSAEEAELRRLGVSEDVIARLHEYDWAVFNSDRRFYQRLQDAGAYLDEAAAADRPEDPLTVDALLDSIGDGSLYSVLAGMDRLTLQLALWKMEGYSSAEVSAMCGLSVSAVNFRMWHLRKKIKNIL